MSKIHWIGDGNIRGWANTACGLSGIARRDGRYDTGNGGIMDAVYRSWEGVTCVRCLRNPHSPSGRVTAMLSSQLLGTEK